MNEEITLESENKLIEFFNELDDKQISEIFLKNKLNVESTWEEILELIDKENRFTFAPKNVFFF